MAEEILIDQSTANTLLSEKLTGTYTEFRWTAAWPSAISLDFSTSPDFSAPIRFFSTEYWELRVGEETFSIYQPDYMQRLGNIFERLQRAKVKKVKLRAGKKASFKFDNQQLYTYTT